MPRARAISERSGGHHPEPALGLIRVDADAYRVVRPLTGEHQVVDQLLLGDAEVRGHAVVAHVLGRVAAEAVVDEVARAALQRGLVRRIHADMVEQHLAARSERRGGHQRGEKDEKLSAHGR